MMAVVSWSAIFFFLKKLFLVDADDDEPCILGHAYEIAPLQKLLNYLF